MFSSILQQSINQTNFASIIELPYDHQKLSKLFYVKAQTYWTYLVIQLKFEQLIESMERQFNAFDSKQLVDGNIDFLRRNIAQLAKRQREQKKKEEDFTNYVQSAFYVENQVQSATSIIHKPQHNGSGLKLKKNDYVKLFIERVKRSSSKYLDLQKVNNKYMHALNKLIEDIQETNTSKIRGIQAKDFVKLFITFLIVVTILSVHLISTFQCFFDESRTSYSDVQGEKVIKIFCLVCSCIKILSSFTFCTNVLGKKLIYLKDIAAYYVSNTDFYLDLLVLVSTLLLLVFDNSQFAGIFGFFATLTNVAYIERMDEAIQIILTTTTKKQFFALLRLLFANFFITHLIATIMLLMVQVNGSDNWMIKYGISGYDWWQKYFYSVYWASTVTTTVGFGDILSSTVYQTIVITSIMLFGCLVLSYNITQVANIISNLSATNLQIKNKLAVLKKLARIRKIDFRLHKQIGQYIIHATEIKRNFEFQEGDQLISSLPTHIRENFAAQSAHNFFAPLSFFFIISNQTKRIIYEKMKLEVLSPKQYVTHKRCGLTKIYLLRMGEAGFAYKKNGSSLDGTILDTILIKNQTKDPEIFNIYLLTRGKQLEYDIICKQYCVVSTLQFEDLYEALNTSEQDNQLYHQNLDAVHFQGNEWGRTKCEYCNIKHSIFVCPKLHFMPLRSITYMKHQRGISKPKQRADFEYNRQKASIVKLSPMKFKNTIFANLEKKRKVDVIKRQMNKMHGLGLSDKEYEQLQEEMDLQCIGHQKQSDYFDVDAPKDYQIYFPENNSGRLKEKKLKKSKSKSFRSILP